MSTKSQAIGSVAVQGINNLEERAHNKVHSGAAAASRLVTAGSRWAGRQENAAATKTRQLKRNLKKQSVQLRKSASASVAAVGKQADQALNKTQQFIKNKPLTALAVASGAALVVGALLGKRHS